MAEEGSIPAREQREYSERIAVLEVQQKRFQSDLSASVALINRSAERLDNAALKISSVEIRVKEFMKGIDRHLEDHETHSNAERSAQQKAIDEIQLKMARKSGEHRAMEASKTGLDGFVTKNAGKLIVALLLTILAMVTGRASSPDPAEVTRRVIESMQEGK